MPAGKLLFAGIIPLTHQIIIMFKKGQKVTARTVRGNTFVDGKVAEIHETQKGKYFEIHPDEKGAKPFRTRESCIESR
jgi:hypothetical protein